MHRRAIRAAGGALVLGLALVPAAGAQESEAELRREIEALKQGQKEIQKELQEIKRLVQARPAAPAAKPAGPNVRDLVLELGDNPVKGEPTAKLVLLEFTDYQ